MIWDISWHRSIGRDTFWTPAHLAIYTGGVLAGCACGGLALRTTFAETPAARDASVSFWGFRAPLGAWFCIWGALAMLTSAPLDNWWHNAYGLDVKVLSPPHTLLAAGLWAIQLGTLLLVLAELHRAKDSRARLVCGLAIALVAGIVIENGAILGIEQVGFANDAHNALYYEFAAGCFPMVLVAAGRCGGLRWSATAAAAAYMLISLVMIWALQPFPATPGLAPVFNPLTHMVPAPFPLLLVVPAVAIDVLLRHFGSGREWRLALACGVAFFVTFLAVQWYAAELLLSPWARSSYLLGVDHWDYSSRLGPWRYEFWGRVTQPFTLASAALAAAIAVVSARVGLWWGSWMARVRR
ncbi:MAG TPA: hypothetical protein VN848_13590 [Gemmatimonadales bacterium]|nr:hypothetical protein [Gemmatimonadales bacterium]